MPTEELKQALRAANVRGVDKDCVDMLCRLFDAPRALVLRIMYAMQYASNGTGIHPTQWMDTEELSADLRKAISEQVKRGAQRIKLRQVLERGGTALVFVDALVKDSDPPERICKGCPKSLDCVAESLSTPAQCVSGEGPIPQRFDVKPIKINGDKITVECTWPEGTCVLDVTDFDE